MKNSATYTSTLPTDLIQLLQEYAQKLQIPKNKLIEKALQNYLKDLKKAEYARSFQLAKQDIDIQLLANQGLSDYLKQLDLL